MRSIRWRIQLCHGILLVLITTVLMVGFCQYEKSVQLQLLDRTMAGTLTNIRPHFIRFGGGKPPSEMEGMLAERGYYLSVWEQGKILFRSANSPPDLLVPDYVPGHGEFSRWNGANRESVSIPPGGRYAFVLGGSGAKMTVRLRHFALVVFGIGSVVVAFGLAIGWWLAGHALRPISEITATAESIVSGDHARRIPLQNISDELGRLAVLLNTAFDRMADAYDQQVRFTADASHELRTPAAVILAQTQMALARERDAAGYKESLAICQRSAERMKMLLGDLLDLSRYDAESPELRLRECDLAEVARESLGFVTPLAAERRVAISDSLASLRGRYDPAGLSHVLINLLINAIKHNPEGCRVALDLREVKGNAIITVTDSGSGIAPEMLPHIFDRFYRADIARSRSTGGSGLGLAICQAIVEAHGGTIAAESGVGTGTTFTIMLPC